MAKKGHSQIQITSIKPRLLNPLRTTCVLPGPSFHAVPSSSLCVCPHYPLLLRLAVPCLWNQACPRPGSLISCTPRVILILSKEFSVLLSWVFPERWRTLCFVDRKKQILSPPLFSLSPLLSVSLPLLRPLSPSPLSLLLCLSVFSSTLSGLDSGLCQVA